MQPKQVENEEDKDKNNEILSRWKGKRYISVYHSVNRLFSLY